MEKGAAGRVEPEHLCFLVQVLRGGPGDPFEHGSVALVLGCVREARYPHEYLFALAHRQRGVGVPAVLRGIGRDDRDAVVAERRLQLSLEERGKVAGCGLREGIDRDYEQTGARGLAPGRRPAVAVELEAQTGRRSNTLPTSTMVALAALAWCFQAGPP